MSGKIFLEGWAVDDGDDAVYLQLRISLWIWQNGIKFFTCSKYKLMTCKAKCRGKTDSIFVDIGNETLERVVEGDTP